MCHVARPACLCQQDHPWPLASDPKPQAALQRRAPLLQSITSSCSLRGPRKLDKDKVALGLGALAVRALTRPPFQGNPEWTPSHLVALNASAHPFSWFNKLMTVGMGMREKMMVNTNEQVQGTRVTSKVSFREL
eukprot:scaffold173429_cov30-Tisochrysis_lutea.AAC.1